MSLYHKKHGPVVFAARGSDGDFFPTFRRFLWISRIVGTSKMTIGFLRQDRNLLFKAGLMLRFQLSVFEHAEHMYTIMSYHCLYHIIHLWAHVLRTANTEDWSGGQKDLEEDHDGTVARVGRILNLSYSTGWYWLMFDVNYIVHLLLEFSLISGNICSH